MNVVGKVGSLISQGVYSVATPFHPFGGAVDIIVVEQPNGTYRSTPWYVRFGKFQGVLKGTEKIVRISVNGVEAKFHMYLDNSGEAYFVREVVSDEDIEKEENVKSSVSLGEDDNVDKLEAEEVKYSDGCISLGNGQADNEFQDQESINVNSAGTSDYQGYHYDSLDQLENVVESQGSDSEVVLISVDGHVLTAPISSLKENMDNVQLSTPQFHLGPGEGAEFSENNEELSTSQDTWASDYLNEMDASTRNSLSEVVITENDDTNSSGRLVEIHKIDQITVSHVQDTSNDHSIKSDVSDSSASRAAIGMRRREIFKSCLEFPELNEPVPDEELPTTDNSDAIVSNMISEYSISNDVDEKDKQVSSSLQASGIRNPDSELECTSVESETKISSNGSRDDAGMGFEISLCGHLLYAGLGLDRANEAFDSHRVSEEDFKASAQSITNNETLVIRYKGRYFTWEKVAPIVLGKVAFGLDLAFEASQAISIEKDETLKSGDDSPRLATTPSGRSWRLWPIPFRRVKTLQHTTSNASSEEVFLDTESGSLNPPVESSPKSSHESPRKQLVRTNVPTTEQIASLNLKDGQNIITFSFSTRVLGTQQVDAHIYLWKWNARIVISDVDGTITKSDVLGQFMPLVGKDWTQSGVAHLFSAIKENGYQLLFLSARAIVQAYLTRSFLLNLKQDGKALPNGPVVISPDGLFPSLYREVIRRAPHEFKIACLEDIKALFPADYNPFYAGFGNRDTDELSYRKIGIPKGKIFIINPKGEVAINHRIDVKSYTSLHTLVNDMFPPTSLVEQEDYNSWNFWKMPLQINID